MEMCASCQRANTCISGRPRVSAISAAWRNQRDRFVGPARPCGECASTRRAEWRAMAECDSRIVIGRRPTSLGENGP